MQQTSTEKQLWNARYEHPDDARSAFEQFTRRSVFAVAIAERDAVCAGAHSYFVPEDQINRMEKLFADAEAELKSVLAAYDSSSQQ